MQVCNATLEERETGDGEAKLSVLIWLWFTTRRVN